MGNLQIELSQQIEEKVVIPIRCRIPAAPTIIARHPVGNDDNGILPGQKMPSVPEIQGALWTTYTWPVEFIRGGEMFLRGEYTFMGETSTDLVPSSDAGNPSFTNESYGLANLRMGLTSPDDGWQVDVFVMNVTDERAQLAQGASTGAYAWSRTGEYDHFHSVYTVRPREYGVRFSARWGD